MYQKEPNRYILKDNYCILQIQYKDIWYDFLIDLDDVETCKLLHWRTVHKKRKIYAITGQYGKNGCACYLHNFVLNKYARKGYEVDHINGNSFDNRKQNLRIVRSIENKQNQHI